MKIDQVIASFVVFSLIGFPFLGLKGIVLSLVYTLFIFFPFHFLISKIEVDFLERFILTNIAGLSYSMILAILDVVIKLRLSKMMFILMPLTIIIISRLKK